MPRRVPTPRVQFERRIAAASRRLVRNILHDVDPRKSDIYTRALLRRVALTAARLRDQLYRPDELTPATRDQDAATDA